MIPPEFQNLSALSRLRAELAELHKDKAIIDELERRGVQSIYFVDGSQINPASQCLRAAMSAPCSGRPNPLE